MRLSRTALQLLFIAWGFLLVEYAIRISDSAIIPELRHSFNISHAGIALLSSSYYFAYIAMQIPAGFIIDKVGLKVSLVFAMLIVLCGCILLANTKQFHNACLARVWMGIGSAFAFISAVKVISQLKRKSSFFIGMTMTIATLGAVLGQEPWLQLTHWLQSWRLTYLLAAGILCFLTLGCLLTKPLARVSVTLNKNPAIFTPLSYKTKVKLLLYVGCLSAPITVFASLWGIPFFYQHLHFSRDVATSIVSASWLGGLLGGPLLGVLADRYIAEIKLLIIIGLLTTLIFIMLLFVPFSLTSYIIMLFVMGVLCNGNVIVFAYFTQHYPVEKRGIMTGLCNTFNMGVGPILQLFVGYALQYSHQQYDISLIIIPLLLLVMSIALISISTTHKRNS